MLAPGTVYYYVVRDFYDILRFYQGGVYRHPSNWACSFGGINHAFIAVGSGPDYIKVKNSWGTNWG